MCLLHKAMQQLALNRGSKAPARVQQQAADKVLSVHESQKAPSGIM